MPPTMNFSRGDLVWQLPELARRSGGASRWPCIVLGESGACPCIMKHRHEWYSVLVLDESSDHDRYAIRRFASCELTLTKMTEEEQLEWRLIASLSCP